MVTKAGHRQSIEARSASGPSSALERERETLLEHVHGALDSIMVLLSLAWIALLVADLLSDGLPRSLDLAFWVIWGLFVLDFAIEFSIAPSKRSYLRSHWLTAVSLTLPALRVVRAFAALREREAASPRPGPPPAGPEYDGRAL